MVEVDEAGEHQFAALVQFVKQTGERNGIRSTRDRGDDPAVPMDEIVIANERADAIEQGRHWSRGPGEAGRSGGSGAAHLTHTTHLTPRDREWCRRADLN